MSYARQPRPSKELEIFWMLFRGLAFLFAAWSRGMLFVS
ncbi:hypothetical protein FHX37_3320 [Haloactinospora alba]|uniref:Uncharacterized protein n=1 Tax=Haloactinospora alba TaxID=405555 RepID=A0A543NNA1_9ACTN|nr:hypothetical protein FHX37_3320 [Haloactinospora alba]